MDIRRLYVGGWFQRTVLHLSEAYDFLSNGMSRLPLDLAQLAVFRDALTPDLIKMYNGPLDYITWKNEGGIDAKFVEDGLILLSTNVNSETEVRIKLQRMSDYYDNKLSPAFNYIFSLGAPVPKELANIQSIVPHFLVVDHATPAEVRAFLDAYGQKEYFEIHKPVIEIYRGNWLYIINNKGEDLEHVRHFIEEQIFIREFKGQLHHYLNVHRTVWENINEIKERGRIRGHDVIEINPKIESYAKTLNLIGGRIKQMHSYIRTREAIAQREPHMQNFKDLLQFEHETLRNTLEYVEEIWKMTKKYVDSAFMVFSAIQAKSTEATLENLTIVTVVGVGTAFLGLFSQGTPQFTAANVVYVIAILVIGVCANWIIRLMARRRMYEIEDVELTKDITQKHIIH